MDIVLLLTPFSLHADTSALINAVGEFNSTPAVDVITSVQSSLHLHTADNFEFIQPIILGMWTVRFLLCTSQVADGLYVFLIDSLPCLTLSILLTFIPLLFSIFCILVVSCLSSCFPVGIHSSCDPRRLETSSLSCTIPSTRFVVMCNTDRYWWRVHVRLCVCVFPGPYCEHNCDARTSMLRPLSRPCPQLPRSVAPLYLPYSVPPCSIPFSLMVCCCASESWLPALNVTQTFNDQVWLLCTSAPFIAS